MGHCTRSMNHDGKARRRGLLGRKKRAKGKERLERKVRKERQEKDRLARPGGNQTKKGNVENGDKLLVPTVASLSSHGERVCGALDAGGIACCTPGLSGVSGDVNGVWTSPLGARVLLPASL